MGVEEVKQATSRALQSKPSIAHSTKSKLLPKSAQIPFLNPNQQLEEK